MAATPPATVINATPETNIAAAPANINGDAKPSKPNSTAIIATKAPI